MAEAAIPARGRRMLLSNGRFEREPTFPVLGAFGAPQQPPQNEGFLLKGVTNVSA